MTVYLASLPTVSVIVPTRGRRKLLEACLQSLSVQNYPHDRFEIIVVEDGTDEGQIVAETQKSGHPVIRYARIPHSGAASAYDVGLDLAQSEVVAFIDDDAQASPDWVQQIASVLVQSRAAGVVGAGGRISPEYPATEFSARLSETGDLIWTGNNAVVTEQKEVDFVPGSNMAFWRSSLQEIGGFDRNFSKVISWRHETDVCSRLRAKGFRILHEPNMVVFHEAARWLDRVERFRPRLVWAMTRDDAYFRAKNFGWRGVRGAVRANLIDTRKRIFYGIANFALIFVHLLAWIPGVWLGLRRKNKLTGTSSA
jgi:glycosyltransferase involved in cell wall biosynthesis